MVKLPGWGTVGQNGEKCAMCSISLVMFKDKTPRLKSLGKVVKTQCIHDLVSFNNCCY